MEGLLNVFVREPETVSRKFSFLILIIWSVKQSDEAEI